MKGYVKLYRKIRDTSIWCDSDKLKLWIYCLTEANHEDQIFLIGNQKIKLKKGQFITGRLKLESEFNRGVKPKKKITDSTLFRYLKVFENLGMLHIKSTNKYSIVTVLNWDKYQINEQQMNNKCTADEQQLHSICTQYKNEKNVKNEKNILNTSSEEEVKLVLDTGEYYTVTNEQIQGWQQSVPLVDVKSELRKMQLWLEGNPRKRKTARGITRFITGWLVREQNSKEQNSKPITGVEDVPDWYNDTKQTEPDQKLLDEIAEIQRKLQMGE